MNKYKLRRSPSLRREVHRLCEFIQLVGYSLPAKPLVTLQSRYTSELVRYILLHKMRYISLRSMRYDINPYCSRAAGTYRTVGISRTKYISQIRQDLYRGACHYNSSIPNPSSKILSPKRIKIKPPANSAFDLYFVPNMLPSFTPKAERTQVITAIIIKAM